MFLGADKTGIADGCNAGTVGFPGRSDPGGHIGGKLNLLAAEKLPVNMVQRNGRLFDGDAAGGCCLAGCDRDDGRTRFAGGDHAITVYYGNTLFIAAEGDRLASCCGSLKTLCLTVFHRNTACTQRNLRAGDRDSAGRFTSIRLCCDAAASGVLRGDKTVAVDRCDFCIRALERWQSAA